MVKDKEPAVRSSSSASAFMMEVSPYTGKLHCGEHDYFGKSMEDFNKHMEDHYVIGGNPKCFQCGQPVPLSIIDKEDNRLKHHPEHKFTEKQVREGKVFHKKCKKEFLNDLAS